MLDANIPLDVRFQSDGLDIYVCDGLAVSFVKSGDVVRMTKPDRNNPDADPTVVHQWRIIG
jgi:hypothetical protein